jgi:hypothetical protein
MTEERPRKRVRRSLRERAIDILTCQSPPDKERKREIELRQPLLQEETKEEKHIRELKRKAEEENDADAMLELAFFFDDEKNDRKTALQWIDQAIGVFIYLFIYLFISLLLCFFFIERKTSRFEDKVQP